MNATISEALLSLLQFYHFVEDIIKKYAVFHFSFHCLIKSQYWGINQNFNNILECDWLTPA